MKCDRDRLLLYAVTDRSWLGEKTLYEQVEEALKGGATFVQLREKGLDNEAGSLASAIAEITRIQTLCRRYKVPFVINDNVDFANRINADGVHVGQSDMDVKNVRRILGSKKIIGVSAQTVEQAVLAQKQGADYLGVGAVFPTGSKADAEDVSYETLKTICDAVDIPVVAIGGISRNNILKLEGSGISGVAVISAIFAADDIRLAAAELKMLAGQVVKF